MLATPFRRRATLIMAAAAAARAVASVAASDATASSSLLPSALPAYAAPGPCGVAPAIRGTFEASTTGDALTGILTLPARDAPGRAAPWPVVWLGSGFQTRAGAYERLAAHLASWGYAAVQYDARVLSLTPDALELGWLGDAVAW